MLRWSHFTSIFSQNWKKWTPVRSQTNRKRISTKRNSGNEEETRRKANQCCKDVKSRADEIILKTIWLKNLKLYFSNLIRATNRSYIGLNKNGREYQLDSLTVKALLDCQRCESFGKV